MENELPLLLLLLLLSSSSLRVSSTSSSQRGYIYVVAEHNSHNDTKCWSGGREEPCTSLAFALEGVRRLAEEDKHLWVLLEPGNYSLPGGEGPASFSGPQVRGFGMVGEEEGEVLISCLEGAGLRFAGVESVTLANITFSGCGAVQPATHVSDSNAMEFHASLRFLKCSNLTLSHVTVRDSQGVGIMVDNSGGQCLFDHLIVSDSSTTETSPISGGLRIEFGPCPPEDDVDCTPSKAEGGPVTGARYRITRSHFTGNSARGSGRMVGGLSQPFLSRGNQHSSAATVGRGGGVAVMFRGRSLNNSVFMEDCSFTGNTAAWGGGLFVSHRDNSTNNSVTVSHSHFNSNMAWSHTAVPGGGGAWVELVFHGNDLVGRNNMTFDTCTFSNNSARLGGGGGVGVMTSRESGVLATNSVQFLHCMWERNEAQSGAGLYTTTFQPAAEGRVLALVLSGSTLFQGNHRDEMVSGQVASLGTLATYSVPVRFGGHVTFKNSGHTALVASAAPLYFLEDSVANFSRNRGHVGGALSLHDSAFLEVGANTTFLFSRNSAELRGGAVFSSSGEGAVPPGLGGCFVRYHDPWVRPEDWNTSFLFEGNVAQGGRPSAIHATSVLPCGRGQTSTDTTQPFCWPGWSYRREDHTHSNCTEQVRTDPSFFNTTRGTSVKMGVSPGIRTHLPASLGMWDDYNRPIRHGVLFTASSPSEEVTVSGEAGYVSDDTLTLMASPNINTSTVLDVDLYTTGSRPLYSRLEVTLLECPTGLTPRVVGEEVGSGSGQSRVVCTCNNSHTTIFKNLVHCYSDAGGSLALLHYSNSWVGKVEGKLLAGNTPYSQDKYYHRLSPNASEVGQSLCDPFHRRDVLCGRCHSRYGPALNSNPFLCMECDSASTWYKWLLYPLTELLPPTIFFLVIMFFNISLTSEVTNSFIFFCQVFQPAFTIYRNRFYHKYIGKFYVTVYDIWNLNFFDSFDPFQYCLHPKLEAIHLIALEYVVALYPLLLTGALYATVTLYNRGFRPIVCLCRPVHHCVARLRGPWNLGTSIVHAFAAFLLLSFIKFTVTSYRLLAPSYLYNRAGHVSEVRVFFQGDMQLFHDSHIVYGTLAIFILATFVALPTLLLLLFPLKSFHRVLAKISRRKLVLTGGKIELFLNTFYGGFRDGTQQQQGSTRDWRSFAGLYFVFRIVLAFITFNQQWGDLFMWQHVFCVLVCLLFAVVRPYREEFYNNVDTVAFGLMALVSVISQYNFQLSLEPPHQDSTAVFVVEMLLLSLPLVYILHRLWAKVGRPAFKRRLRQAKERVASVQQGGPAGGGAGVEPSNAHSSAWSWKETSETGSHLGDDSLMRLVDEHQQLVASCERAGPSPQRRVQFATPRAVGSSRGTPTSSGPSSRSISSGVGTGGSSAAAGTGSSSGASGSGKPSGHIQYGSIT